MLEVTLYTILATDLALLGVASRQLGTTFKTYAPPKRKSPLGQEVDLPSVTVCIPARNEGHALAYSLERIIASSYDKLEIIVLDDVSGDDTSALIKSFASEGVRFVKGAPLPEDWLGKNHALQGLLNEASGTYVLFMDVDTRLSPDAIENLVRYTIAQRATMVSVLPRREDGWRLSVLFSPLRYFWELIFNRHNSPASASSVWMIRRKVLDDRFGGFNTLKNAIQPEARIADTLSLSNEYRFLISSSQFGFAYEKKWRSQLITSVRLLFPLLGKNITMVFAACVVLALLLVPFVIMIIGFINGFEIINAAALFISLLIVGVYGMFTHRVWKNGWFIGALLVPALILQEIILILASVFQYKRKTVTWKGRIIQPEVRN